MAVRAERSILRALKSSTALASRAAMTSLSAIAWSASATLARAEPSPLRANVADVVVTGARYETKALESASPIQTFSQAKLLATGQHDLRLALQQIVPSYFLAQSGGGTSKAVKSSSLRGLGGNEVLVLVDGKRRHNTSLVNSFGGQSLGASPADLGYIPISAVDHVEILFDGAAAQYGSDAIAGVINVILKKNDSGGSFHGTGGFYNAYASDQGGVGDQGATYDFDVNQGVQIGSEGGFLSLSAQSYHKGKTNTAGPFRGQILAAGDPPFIARYRQIVEAFPRQSTQAFLYNLAVPVDGFTFYSNSTFGRRTSDGWGSFRAETNQTWAPGAPPGGFQPWLRVGEEDFQSVVGLRGEGLFGWDWDGSLSFGQNRAQNTVYDSYNASYGPAISGKSIFDIGNQIAREGIAALDFKRRFDTSFFQEPLHVAVGAEYRWNQFQVGAGEYLSYTNGGYRYPADYPYAPYRNKYGSPGSAFMTGYAPTDAVSRTRSNYAGYVDLAQKVTPQWEINGAGRFEYYTDFGATASGKISTRYEISPELAVRGTVSNGFRAPSLAEQYYQAGELGFSPNPVTLQQQLNIRRYSSSYQDPAARAVGAQRLKPEESISVSLGFVTTPFENFSLTIDAYQIDIRDRIYLSTPFDASTTPEVAQAFAANGVTNVTSVSYFANVGDTRTRGVDVKADYATDFGPYGNARWSLAYSHNDQSLLKQNTLPANLAATGLTLLSRDRIGLLTTGYPRDMIKGTIDYVYDRVTLHILETFYGRAVTPDKFFPDRDHISNPSFITDVSLSYDVLDNLRFTIGADNLFNKLANSLSPTALNAFNFQTFSPQRIFYSPYSTAGGYYYARIGYTW
jgi:iron complex outermembrane receptor protein